MGSSGNDTLGARGSWSRLRMSKSGRSPVGNLTSLDLPLQWWVTNLCRQGVDKHRWYPCCWQDPAWSTNIPCVIWIVGPSEPKKSSWRIFHFHVFRYAPWHVYPVLTRLDLLDPKYSDSAVLPFAARGSLLGGGKKQVFPQLNGRGNLDLLEGIYICYIYIINIHTYIPTYICIYAYVYIYIYVCMYVYIPNTDDILIHIQKTISIYRLYIYISH